MFYVTLNLHKIAKHDINSFTSTVSAVRQVAPCVASLIFDLDLQVTTCWLEIYILQLILKAIGTSLSSLHRESTDFLVGLYLSPIANLPMSKIYT